MSVELRRRFGVFEKEGHDEKREENIDTLAMVEKV